MMTPDPFRALQDLGLTGLESEIYVQLLKESPLTGYSIAKRLAKPVANVYKALDTLAKKGAIELEEGKTRRVRPMPYEELLRNMEANFKRLRDNAAASLADLPGPESDRNIYYLHNMDQVLGKCQSMLVQATTIVVADVFPQAAELLRADFANLIARGVTLILRTYEPFQLSGAIIKQAKRGDTIQKRWPAQWLNLVVDGGQSIVAVFETDAPQVIQSYWTTSPSIAYLNHNGLMSEVAFATLQQDIEAKRSHAQMEKTVNSMLSYMGDPVPGFARLVSNLGIVPKQEKIDSSHE
jgi:HTH-type transcriptional regulator, sugar sensing transcriptional regulator